MTDKSRTVLLTSHSSNAWTRYFLMLDFARKFTQPYRWLFRMLREKKWNEKEFPYAQLHFSQCGEDVILASLFANEAEGFWIDVGAFHPFHFSNTWLLYKKGWTGINVEPNPQAFALFQEHRPKDINLSIAVGDKANTSVEFWINGPYSSFSREAATVQSKNPYSVKVQTTTLAEIVRNHVPRDKQVDLLSIDCEGHDLIVLKSADWSSFHPKCLIVENPHGINAELSTFIESLDYRLLLRIGLSCIYVRQNYL